MSTTGAGHGSFGVIPARRWSIQRVYKASGVTAGRRRAGPGRVLMGPHDRRVDPARPVLAPRPGHSPPATHPGSSPRYRPVTSGDAGYRRSSSSRNTRADPATANPSGSPDHPVDHTAVLSPTPTPAGSPIGQQRFQPCPLLISRVMAIKHTDDLSETPQKIHRTRPKGLMAAGRTRDPSAIGLITPAKWRQSASRRGDGRRGALVCGSPAAQGE